MAEEENAGELGDAALFGAAGASGFLIAYVIAAFLFALPCAVPCLSCLMGCIGCECLPKECCDSVHDDDHDDDSEYSSELIHTQRQRKAHASNAYASFHNSEPPEDEVAFQDVNFVSGGSKHRLHERLLDQSEPAFARPSVTSQSSQGPRQSRLQTTHSSSSHNNHDNNNNTNGGLEHDEDTPPPPPPNAPTGPPPLLAHLQSGEAGSNPSGDQLVVPSNHDNEHGDSGGGSGGGGGGGHFGTFLILVELLASIPESLLLAAEIARGKEPNAVLASVIVLNVAAGFAMFVDLLRPASSSTGTRRYGRRGHSEARIHQLMFLATSAAAGLLIFAISAEVYIEFEEVDPECNVVDTAGPMIELFAGTLVGALLVLLLVWFSSSRRAFRLKNRLLEWLSCFRRRAYLRSARGTVTSVSSLEALEDQGDDSESLVRHNAAGLSMRNPYIKSLALVLFLSAWLFFLTIIGFVIFKNSAGAEHFIEGISGGAFIITIGGTLIPEAQKSAHLSRWSSLQKEVVSACTFLVGFLCAVIIVVLTEEHDYCLPDSLVPPP